jgi:hypothetical protein
VLPPPEARRSVIPPRRETLVCPPFEELTVLLYGEPKVGKCLEVGTLVMMADGSLRKVEDVKVGERLMGPGASRPLVISTVRGEGPLYRVSQCKGESYVVNDAHLLYVWDGRRGQKRYRTIRADEFVQQHGAFKHHAKGVKASLWFERSEVPLPPRLLGLWLGDGTRSTTTIHNPDPEIIEAIAADAESIGCTITVRNDEERCPAISVVNRHGHPNPMRDALRDLGIFETKRIPVAYLHNHEDVRRAVLAGLLDTDGYAAGTGVMEIASVSDGLAEDIVWLARSLGFRATNRRKVSRIQSSGFEGVYNRIFLAGDFSELPLVLPRRRAKPHGGKRNPLHTGLVVEPAGRGEWAGFELEGDSLQECGGKLFLLSDFTVTHNTSFIDETPGMFFIATEPGQDFVRSPVVRIVHWGWDIDPETKRYIVPQGDAYVAPKVEGGVLYTNFKDLVRHLYREKREGVLEQRSAAIDIVDNLYKLCLDAVCARRGVDYPPENDRGKVWSAIRSDWEEWLRKLMDIVNVSFITHTTTDKIEMKNAKGMTVEIERRVPTFKGNRPAQFLDGVVNCMGFAHFDAAGERWITFKGDPKLGTGDRTRILEQLGAMPLHYKNVSQAYAAKAKELGYEIKSKWT